MTDIALPAENAAPRTARRLSQLARINMNWLRFFRTMAFFYYCFSIVTCALTMLYFLLGFFNMTQIAAINMKVAMPYLWVSGVSQILTAIGLTLYVANAYGLYKLADAVVILAEDAKSGR